MGSIDNEYIASMNQLLVVLRRLRIEQNFPDVNFTGKGESVYSTFLRVIGLITYSDEIESQIPLNKRVENGKTLVAQLFRGKSDQAEQRRKVFTQFLKSLVQQLEKYIRDTNLTQIKRIRKQIGPPSQNPRFDTNLNALSFTGDVVQDTKLVNETLAQYDQQRDGIGQLVREIDLLTIFTSSLQSLVATVFQGNTTAADQPLGSFGGPFASLIQLQTQGYQQRLDNLTERRIALNAQLILLQQKMKIIRSGIEFITGEPISLLSIVDTLVYLLTEVTYTCKQCQNFSSSAIENGGLNNPLLTADQQLLQRAREVSARQNLKTGSQAGASGYCVYRAANLSTTEKGSCSTTWNLIDNDFWQASDSAEDGKEDVISKVKTRLDPRKR